ncbi:MAG: hypothetical protein R2715_22340 [Ilumatobacteraceae bacterium]
MARDLMNEGVRANSIAGHLRHAADARVPEKVLEVLSNLVPFPKLSPAIQPEFGSLVPELVRNTYFNGQEYPPRLPSGCHCAEPSGRSPEFSCVNSLEMWPSRDLIAARRGILNPISDRSHDAIDPSVIPWCRGLAGRLLRSSPLGRHRSLDRAARRRQRDRRAQSGPDY